MSTSLVAGRPRLNISPRHVWIVAGGVCCLYLLCLLLLPARPVFWSPDEGGKYLTLRQLVTSGQWASPLSYPAASIDPQLNNVPLLYWLRVDNAIYSWWPIWFPALSSGPFQLLGVRGLVLIPIGSALLIGLVVYAVVASISKRAALGASIAVTLASPVWFYGLTYWEHTLHTLLVLLAVTAAIKSVTTRRVRWAALSGGLFGLALYLRLETVIFIGAIGLLLVSWLMYRLQRRESNRAIVIGALVFGASLLVAVAPFLTHNWLTEGHPLGRRNTADVTRTIDRALSYGRDSALEIVPNLVIGSVGHQGVDLKPYLRWLFVVAAIGCFISGRLLRRGLEIPVYLAAMMLIALSGFVLLAPDDYSSIHGLVLIAPYLGFAGWSLHPTADRVTRLWGLTAVAGGVMYVIATAVGGWSAQGGLQWGPRYALPLMTIMLVAVARGAHALWIDAAISIGAKRAAIGCLIVLVLIGFGFQLRGIRNMIDDKQKYVTWETQLRALPADALIVTDLNWLALTLPGVYESRAWLQTDPAALPADTLSRIERNGFKRICQIDLVFDSLRPTCVDLSTLRR